jgi:hypothetical protein
MSIQSKSARILAVVSVLALASACGEGAEGAEPQQSPAQLAPDSLKEQEAAAFNPDDYGNCTNCMMDLWVVGQNGEAAGWACNSTYPGYPLHVRIDKWNGFGWQEIGQGWANAPNDALRFVCGGSPNHQFKINVGPHGGPGKYQVVTTLSWSPKVVRVRAFYK